MRPFRVLFLGDLAEGTTSLQRYWAMVALGHDVVSLPSFPGRVRFWQRVDNWLYRKGLDRFGFHSFSINEQICHVGGSGGFNLLWIEKGVYITSKTLQVLRKANPGLKIVGYSPDYMAARHTNSRLFIQHSRHYDLFVTTKSYAVDWHMLVGCKKVLFQGNAFDPATHRPVRLSSAEKSSIGGPVGFIGSFEKERCADIAYLGSYGVPVKVYGDGWQNARSIPGIEVVGRSVMGQDYARAICSFDINLVFLRKINSDLQTTRSVEIPACGGFMLAERTVEHLQLFKEGVEAEYFSSKQELVDKCRYYLAHERQRAKIASAGLQRCRRSGCSYQDRLRQALNLLRAKS
jgi:hypothetical protein